MAQDGGRRRQASDRRASPDRQAEHRRLRKIIDRMADGIVVVNEDGTIRFANPAAELLFGRSQDRLVGEPFGFPVVPNETAEIDLLRGDGKSLTVELRTVEIDWKSERARLASLRDMTDRKEAEEQARQLARETAARKQAEKSEREKARLYEEARQASEAKSEFLGVMSHELRTPLSAIIGYTDLLETEVVGPVNEKQGEELGRIQSRASHLLELVEEILAFSRTEAGTEQVEREPARLDALVRETADEIEPRAREKGLEFDVRVPDAPVDAEIDPGKVRRILSSLLSNAVKYTDEGRVSIALEADDARALAMVRDTGAGIPPERQDDIFTAFWQIEDAMTREQDGAGLGLALARRLARLLGGNVTIESAPGEGSTFTVELPLS